MSLKKNILAVLFFCTISFVAYQLNCWQIDRAHQKKIILESIISEPSTELESYRTSWQYLIFDNQKKIIIERGDKKYDCYQECYLDDHKKFLLFLGTSNNMPNKDSYYPSQKKLHLVRLWPLEKNIFIKKHISNELDTIMSYQVSDVLNQLDFQHINSQYILIDEQPPDGFQKKNMRLPITPEKHQGYAWQWKLISITALFFTFYFLGNSLMLLT
jgi:hypothetical protein